MTEPLSATTLASAPPIDCDVAIVGAGPVGLALARALADSPLRVVLIDARPRGAWTGDPRALALAYGSRQLLTRLDAWDSRAASPIREIHVSQRGGFGRTLIEAADYGVDALGYVMRYGDLADTLAADMTSARWLDACAIEGIESTADGLTLELARTGATRERLTARLVVHADGTPERSAQVSVRDYRQHAIVAEVEPARAHGGRAWERFTPDGPLALLPLESRYALVLTVPSSQAPRLLALDDQGFLGELRQRFGRRVEFVACGARAAFALALRVREPLVRGREVWIGNSAQTLHPVSGQGFNLGLRDAVELAARLVDDAGADPGDPERLAAYARGRALDRRFGMGFTDGIVRLFSNDVAPLRCARGLGLLALDLAPPLRHFVAKRMIWGARAWP